MVGARDFGPATGISAPLKAGDPRRAKTPEQALLEGLLESALRELRLLSTKNHPAARAETARIREWIFDDSDTPTIAGFKIGFVCDHLKIDADFLRGKIREGVVPTLDELRQRRRIDPQRRLANGG